MLDDASSKAHGSPDWWLLRLGKQLADQQARFNRLESYWRGNPPMPFGNTKMRDAYRRLQRMSRTNFGALLAEAVLERLKVMGFRAGADATEDADMDAWRIWQRNGLDADSGLVHRAAVIMSRAYVIVGDDPDEPGQPLVTVEDPRQVIHEAAPTNRRKVIAALKTWWDDIEGCQLAVLYLPETIHYYRSVGAKQSTNATELWTSAKWDPDTSIAGEPTVANDLDEVPVTPFVNRPDMSGEGLGEFEDVLDILDRINTMILDRMVISAMQAYRQRWAKGVRLTDDDGNDTSAFDPGADLLWAVEDDSAQFGEFSVTDLTPLVKAIESDVQYLGSISRTPPSYLLAGIVNASGDALAAAEVGLVSKVTERSHEFGESWERVYRHIGKRMKRDIDTDAEVLWKDPQFRSLTEMAAASVQLKGADVPWRTRMRLLAMTPSEIDRMEAERMQDAMTAALMAPLLQPQVGPGGEPNPAGAGTADTPTPLDPGATGEKPPGATGARSGRTGGTGPRGSASTREGQSTSTSLGGGSSWDDLYRRARAAGVRGASKMTKAQLRAAIGD